jgi:putative ABC transport system substrate-binding protein
MSTSQKSGGGLFQSLNVRIGTSRHYEGYHDAANYVDRIFHGASPGDLAIAGPTHFIMSANRTALSKLGLSLPPDLDGHIGEWVD